MSISPINKMLLIIGPLIVFFGLPLFMVGFCIENCQTSLSTSVANWAGLAMLGIGTTVSVYGILLAIYQTRLPKKIFWGVLIPGFTLLLVLFLVRRQ